MSVLCLQNGTTSSITQIVELLNKADLPDSSKVGAFKGTCTWRCYCMLGTQVLAVSCRGGGGPNLCAHPFSPEQPEEGYCSISSKHLGEGQWCIYRGDQVNPFSCNAYLWFGLPSLLWGINIAPCLPEFPVYSAESRPVTNCMHAQEQRSYASSSLFSSPMQG